MAEAERTLLSKKNYPNVLNYVYDHRGVTFEQHPFSLLDYLVFASVAYIPFEEFEKTNEDFEPKPLSGLMMDYLSWLTVDKLDIDFPNWMRNTLFLAMSLLYTTRYQKVRVTRFRYVFDEAEQTQFGALLFTLPDHTITIAYRGTDNSILGWKEDFAMAVSESVAGQKLADSFLQEALLHNKSKQFTITGHSKGANFAVYAASHLKKKQVSNLLSIYSFDGPGLSESEFHSEGHQRIQSRIVHVVPKDDAIGTLLYHETPTIIVDAGSKKDEGDFAQQHDSYTWKVNGDELVQVSELTSASRFVTASLNEWIGQMPPSQRKDLVSALFEITEKAGIEKSNEVYEHFTSFAPKFIYYAGAIDRSDKKIVVDATITLFGIFAKNLPLYFQKYRKTSVRKNIRRIRKSEA